MKRYPAQGGTLSAIPLAIEIAKDAGGVANLDRIEVSVGHGVYISAVRDAEKWHPATRATADHSLPYIIARAMIDGDIDDESWRPAKTCGVWAAVMIQWSGTIMESRGGSEVAV